MANYDVNIAIALKNSNKLIQLRKELKGATDNIREFNKEASKQNKVAVSTFNKLNKQISRARSLLDRAAIGTSSFTRAAKAAVAVEKEMNLQLRQKEKLLAKIRAESVTPGQQAVIDRTTRARQIKSGFAGFSARADQVTEAAKIEAVRNKARDKHLKNIDKKVAKIATIQTQQQSQKAFAALPGGSFGVSGGLIGPRLPLRNRLGFGKNAQGGPFSMPGGVLGRAKGGFGSALIGGGFPFLFGAGGLSAAMGGIAGGIGGALAPGGGFAASIAATAIASQVEKAIQFRKAIKKLNEEVSSMGIESEFSRKNIKKLAKEFDITNDEAVQLATTVKTFGEEQGLGLLSLFGSRENLDTLAGLRDTSSVLGKIQTFKNDISEKTRQELLQTLATKGSLQAQLDLEEALISKKRRKFIEDKKAEDLKEKNRIKGQRGLLFNKFKPLKDTETPEQQLQRLNDLFVFANASQFELLNNQIKINEQLQFLAEFQAPTDQLREMLNPMRQILDLSVSIRDGFEESFKGIIKGTMTVQEAFRSMLNRIADHFLDTAARMAATQIQKGFLGLFSGMFNFGTTNRANQFLGGVANPFGGGGSSGISFGSVDLGVGLRANGGPVKRGGSFIVGERGPELFTPGVSGMITPNHALGGSTSIVVNVDASGSSVEGDEEQANAFGSAIATAIQSELIKQKRPGGLLA